MKEYEMQGTYSMRGRDDKCIQNFGLRAQMEKTTWMTLVYVGG
jgi:hypothetical protein